MNSTFNSSNPSSSSDSTMDVTTTTNEATSCSSNTNNDNNNNSTELLSPDQWIIVDATLQAFWDANPVGVLLKSSKILCKLLQNALHPPTSDNMSQYRRIRLENPTIKAYVVEIEGAMDVLSMAGFVRDDAILLNDTNGYAKCLVYRPFGSDSTVSAEQQQQQQEALINAICHGLQTKIPEWQQQVKQQQQQQQQQQSTLAVSSTTTSTSTANTDNPFLSDQERQERVARAKAMKKAKKQAQQQALKRWEENKQDRLEAQARKEQLKQLQSQQEQASSQDDIANDLPLGVTIRSATTKTSKQPKMLPKPFEPAPDNHNAKNALVEAAKARRERHVMAHVSQPLSEENNTMAKAVKSDQNTDDDDMSVDEDDNEHDPKPAAAKSTAVPMAISHTTNKNIHAINNNNTTAWINFLDKVPRCAAATGIRDTSYYYRKNSNDTMPTNLVPRCLKTLYRELDSLKDNLPSDANSSIWIRFDEETPQYLRAMISAPGPNTPYAGGLFVFDLWVPADYPQVPPKVQLQTTGGGKVRFGPNLYADGKVCLSLLGTWSGPSWDPHHSTLQQVLVSIQSLILGVEHPYYLEPGHGGWEDQIKEGQFQQHGHTLTGRTVQEEVGVPQQVIHYEDQIRVGTVKYAMIDMLQQLSIGGDKKNNKKNQQLAPFAPVIQAHFATNRYAILEEVQRWASDAALGRIRASSSTKMDIDVVTQLLPKLQSLLGGITMPTDFDLLDDDIEMNDENHKDEAASDIAKKEDAYAKPTKGVAAAAVKKSVNDDDMADDSSMDEEQDSKQPSRETNVMEPKRRRMQQAAQDGNYILAGQLQEELTRLETLQKNMKEAAQRQDFIRAGRLQAQFQALTATDNDGLDGSSKKRSRQANVQSQMAVQDHQDVEMSDDSDEEGVDSESDDDSSMAGGDTMGGPPVPGFAQGMTANQHQHHPPPHAFGSNIFPPAGYKNHHMSRRHAWGTGSLLGTTMEPESTVVAKKPAAKSAKKVAPKKSIPPEDLCRLRIRLPNDKSVVEDFDMNDPLSSVYRRIEGLLPNNDNDGGSHGAVAAVAPLDVRGGGAFSRPLSSLGFTLLLTRPKREFSLEMHGTKSLLELNLAPSATLTVMKCSDRGVMYRGELESRLREAQGDAIDVEGLTYEGLMELTERVGGAAPSEGSAFVALTQEQLDTNSQLLSPARYLKELGKICSTDEATDEAERKCPICLGEYDGSDTTKSLRKLTNCEHIFHTACLETWLGTKSSCPLCKTCITSD